MEAERHNRRDNSRINTYFGKVDGFCVPDKSLLMVECAHNKINAFVNYSFAPYKPCQWNTSADVVWDARDKTCTTYVGGSAKYYCEDAYLDALYKRSSIHNGRKPASPESVEESIMWLSNRHRLYDRYASAMDIDAWSTTTSGPVIWDFKFFLGNWSDNETRVINILKKDYPLFKVKYSLKEGEWFGRDVSDWAEIIPVGDIAEELSELVGLPGGQLTIEDACIFMSLIVRQHEQQ